jgi:hypothetical protein
MVNIKGSQFAALKPLRKNCKKLLKETLKRNS